MKRYWTIFLWMLSVTKGHRGSILLCTLLGMIKISLGWCFVWISKSAVDIATGVAEGGLYQVLLLLPLCMVGELVSSAFSTWLANVRNVIIDNKVKTDIFRHLIDSEWRGIEKYHTGDVINRLESDVASVVGFATGTCPDIIILVFQLVGSFLMLWHLDCSLAVIILCITPLFLLMARYYAVRLHKITREVRECESRVQCQLQENLQYRSVIKTLEQTDGTLGRLQNAMIQLVAQIRERTKLSIGTHLLMSGGFGLGYFLTFGWGVVQISKGIITYGTMTAFLQLSGRVQRPIADLSKQIPVFIRCFTSAERLLELLELPQEEVTPCPQLKAPVGIRLDHVSFSYPDGDAKSKAVFSDFSYDFRPQGTVAILGETGAGKTTLIRLLLALVRPSQGSIKVYNEAGEEQMLDAGSRRYFTYVPQGNTLLSGTVRSNLLMGAPEATEEQMTEALRLAAADFVFSLPKGLDTPCGERGGGLSEGQAQRITIARALLRTAPILLLDESTSALDPDTEQKVLDNLAASQEGRLIILVTHRPAAAQRCSQVLHIGDKKAKIDAQS